MNKNRSLTRDEIKLRLVRIVHSRFQKLVIIFSWKKEHKPSSRWWFHIFYFHTYLGKRSNLTYIFQMVVFNHQLGNHWLVDVFANFLELRCSWSLCPKEALLPFLQDDTLELEVCRFFLAMFNGSPKKLEDVFFERIQFVNAKKQQSTVLMKFHVSIICFPRNMCEMFVLGSVDVRIGRGELFFLVTKNTKMQKHSWIIKKGPRHFSVINLHPTINNPGRSVFLSLVMFLMFFGFFFRNRFFHISSILWESHRFFGGA